MTTTSILVIRGEGRFSALLNEAGLSVINLPLIQTNPLNDLSHLRSHIRDLERYDGIFLTSAEAAKVLVREGAVALKDYSGKLYVLGERSKDVLKKAGVTETLGNGANTIDELLHSFDPSEFDSKNFLFVRGNRSLNRISEALDGRAHVDDLVVYETKAVQSDAADLLSVRDALASDHIDWVCFFSPSAVEAFSDLFAPVGTYCFKAAVIGETTAKAAQDAGLTVGYVSPRSVEDVFANGLIETINAS